VEKLEGIARWFCGNADGNREESPQVLTVKSLEQEEKGAEGLQT
jgi:hypothetical protein